MFQPSANTKKFAIKTIEQNHRRVVQLLELGEYKDATQLLAAQLLIASSLLGGDPHTISHHAGDCLCDEVETMMRVMLNPKSAMEQLMERMGLHEEAREKVRANASRMGVSLEESEKGRDITEEEK